MMSTTPGSLLVFGIFLAGCAHAPEDRPLTPTEKTRLIDEAQAQQVRKDGQMGSAGSAQRTGCVISTRIVRLNARITFFSGPDGFDSRGCVVDGN
jgi:hypothetical protein